MNTPNQNNKLVLAPGRFTSAAIEKIICGAYEVWDDTLNKRQSELNAQFKAVTDQEQIALNGGMVDIASNPDDIVEGSGAIVTANALAEFATTFMKGISTKVVITNNVTVSGSVQNGEQKTIIYTNNTLQDLTVTVPSTTYKTPDGQPIIIIIRPGGYGEVNILNIGGTLFARGC